MSGTNLKWQRLAATVLALTLVFSVAACGDDEPSDSQRADNPATTADEPTTENTAPREPQKETSKEKSPERDPAPGEPTDQSAAPDQPTGDQTQEVADTVTGLYGAMVAGDAVKACSYMTRALRDAVASTPPPGQPANDTERTCPQSFSAFLKAAGSGLQRLDETTVQGVDVDGSKATAKVRVLGRNGELQLVLEDGAWRFGSLEAVPGAK